MENPFLCSYPDVTEHHGVNQISQRQISQILFQQDFDADFFLRGERNALIVSGLEDADGASDKMPRILCYHRIDVAVLKCGFSKRCALVHYFDQRHCRDL